MKLFTYATSPYARKVRMALDSKGVPYEPVERCHSIDRHEDLRCATPRAEVPTVVLDDGRIITDSTIICEYLEGVSAVGNDGGRLSTRNTAYRRGIPWKHRSGY